MKFAIITTGGKQYKVVEGKVYRFEKIDKKKDAAVIFDKVLLSSDGKTTEIGRPLIKGAKATGQIQDHGKSKKVMVIKFRNKIRYRRKKGHRQNFTSVKIDKITVGK